MHRNLLLRSLFRTWATSYRHSVRPYSQEDVRREPGRCRVSLPTGRRATRTPCLQSSDLLQPMADAARSLRPVPGSIKSAARRRLLSSPLVAVVSRSRIKSSALSVSAFAISTCCCAATRNVRQVSSAKCPDEYDEKAASSAPRRLHRLPIHDLPAKSPNSRRIHSPQS